MKLYLKNVNISNDYDDYHELLCDYSCNKKTKTRLYSAKGIFELQQDNMYILKSCDVTPEIVKIDKFTGLLDKSHFIRDELWYQLPCEHFMEETNVLTYKLRDKGLVELIIEEKNNQIKDFYFEMKDEFDVLGIEEDILTFLSALKLY